MIGSTRGGVVPTYEVDTIHTYPTLHTRHLEFVFKSLTAVCLYFKSRSNVLGKNIGSTCEVQTDGSSVKVDLK